MPSSGSRCCPGCGAGTNTASTTGTSSTGWCASLGRLPSTATARSCSPRASSGWPMTPWHAARRVRRTGSTYGSCTWRRGTARPRWRTCCAACWIRDSRSAWRRSSQRWAWACHGQRFPRCASRRWTSTASTPSSPRRRSRMTTEAGVKERLAQLLRELNLPTVRARYDELARQAERETLSYERFLLGLCEQESQARQAKRIGRLLRASCLPLEKSLETFDLKRLPAKVARQVQSLREGDF